MVAPDGALAGVAQHRTTPPEVMTGVAAVTSALPPASSVLACSSAGGGLRLAVVGQERLVSAEAGHRVALSAGAKVVHVSAGPLSNVYALRASDPDVVLLVGGTDGGDEKVLLHNAACLGRARVTVPVVLAGNKSAQPEALSLLAGRTVVATDNVLPDVGELAPDPARAAIREVFLAHVIGGKGLSRGRRFRDLVRTVTPDAVLSGVATLAAQEEGAVLVVDVGGATTDVYSAVSTADDTPATTVALPPDRRTVEGDIGMRVSAPGVVAEAITERLLAQDTPLAAKSAHRNENVDFVPATDDEREADLEIARLAATLAIRRHLRMVGRLGPTGATVLVLSGGVFRHAQSLAELEKNLRADLGPVLRNARVVVDRDGRLGPAGLLAQAGHDTTAAALLAALR
ncbi:glutamate mutase L [Actinophytocola oryzae]|uniref:glutamate mutase L n=1 Tax=Actinophytocola oryzae TaxID=502181 RepID=UPI001FB8A679|nr:glutamate mutase L [Actinophytocola oryzae]